MPRPAPAVPPETLLRRACSNDLPALLALESLFPSDRLSRRSWRRLLTAASAVVVVADRAGVLLGNAILLTRRGSRVARLYSVVVADAARGEGLGGRLVAAIEQAAQQRGCTRLQLEVRADNTAARALYAKRGYQTVASLPAYYDDGADGLRLANDLPLAVS